MATTRTTSGGTTTTRRVRLFLCLCVRVSEADHLVSYMCRRGPDALGTGGGCGVKRYHLVKVLVLRSRLNQRSSGVDMLRLGR